MTSTPVGRGVLRTDAYQITMAQLYHRLGLHERPARFEHFYRSNPDYGEHQAGYCVTAGLGPFLDWAARTRATDADVVALRRHEGRTGAPLFDEAFCDWFADVDFGGLSISAVPEGRVVHPNAPITVVEGSLAEAQLIETPLLNQLNFPTLIATKASRVVEAAHGRPVLEFGMRRGPADGADDGSRAALIGGAIGTSNAAEGYRLGVAPTGTHAHSMVQLFMALGEGELGAFEAYADVYPDDCLLLVDTVDTLQSGIPNAIRVFERLRRGGHAPVGVRLDSGDLAYLAVQSARQLADAGFGEVSIVLSSDLDELRIWQILQQIADEAPRSGIDADDVIARLVFGVGSRLASSHGDSSLDGVYKLVAVDEGGTWLPAMKLSDNPAKLLNPGPKRLWRLYDADGTATADVLSTADETLAQGDDLILHHHARSDLARSLPGSRWSRSEELLVPVFRGGRVIDAVDDPHIGVQAARARRDHDVALLDPGVRRIVNPHLYHVSITDELARLKQE
ncbi:MAG: nicotinate phosphoribosyltransferase, partial [Ilumatobacter sp.]|nr:nicotinate phosphoribosyltransferase [Ilumatobacter sp.]